MLLTVVGWLIAGMLISFGIVGLLTGLLLLPFGITLAIWAARRQRGDGWPAFVIGLGTGPVVLLGGDVVGQGEPPTAAVPAFWIGVACVLVGIACGAWSLRQPG